MNRQYLQCIVLGSFLCLAASPTGAQEPEGPSSDSATEASSTDKQKKSDESKPSQQELEAKFIATLTKATMTGRWCLIRDGKLTPDKEDKYEIVSVSKGADGGWMVMSRVEYNDQNFVAPVPIKLEWAGDTPVMIIDDLTVPGGSTYSARVLVYDDSYAGTWSGPRVKGLLNGMITREKAKTDDVPEGEGKVDETN